MDMSPVLNAINAHRSIRKYLDRPVAPEILERILGAALMASSSGNMQAYSIIVTEDPALKEELYPLHFHQKMILEAPLLLTFCADFHRMRQWLKIREAPDNFDNPMSFMIGAIDAILASQNAALAAESEGLGICYMGTTLANCRKIAKVLRCPNSVVPVVGFSLGYPNEEPNERDRLPLPAIVHKDFYRESSTAEITEIYRKREIDGMERYLADPELRARCEEGRATNLAQVYTKIKYTRDSHQAYSRELLECLREQNFLSFTD